MQNKQPGLFMKPLSKGFVYFAVENHLTVFKLLSETLSFLPPLMYYNQSIANEKLLLRKFMTYSKDTELGRGGIGASSQVPPTPGPGLLKHQLENLSLRIVNEKASYSKVISRRFADDAGV